MIAAMMVPRLVPTLEAEVADLRHQLADANARLAAVTAERDEYRTTVHRLRGWCL